MSISVDILLSTYNGEEYLADQIDSILQQTFCNWHLIIRDDGSSDKTLSIIDKYLRTCPNKITYITCAQKRLGPTQSFASLMLESKAPYIAFCDQDDEWLPNKLQVQVEKIIELEELNGQSTPILVHSDLIVVNDKLDLISESFWIYQHLAPNKMSSLQRQLIQNCVTGCTVLINRSLLGLASPIPNGVIMHDWWLALIAVSQGMLCELDAVTVKYRQHDNNDTGAKKWGVSVIFAGFFSGFQANRKRLQKTNIQAEMFAKSIALSDHNQKIVKAYLKMYKMSWLKRRIQMIKMGFFKCGFLRNVAMLMYL